MDTGYEGYDGGLSFDTPQESSNWGLECVEGECKTRGFIYRPGLAIARERVVEIARLNGWKRIGRQRYLCPEHAHLGEEVPYAGTRISLQGGTR
jgi:hypothetical protein